MLLRLFSICLAVSKWQILVGVYELTEGAFFLVKLHLNLNVDDCATQII